MDISPATATTAPPTTAPRRLRSYDELPGPRGLPLVGNALQLDTEQFHRQLEQWAREYGDFYRLRLRDRRLLVVGEHQAVAAVLRDRPDGFRRTTRLEQIWVELGLPIGVFGANGETWQRQRRMVMAGFDPGHVRRYLPAMQKVALRLVGRWQQAVRDGRPIDLQADLMRYTVDTIAGLAFGEAVNTLQSDGDVIQRHLDKIFPAVFKRVLAPLPLWRWYRSAADRELQASIAEVNKAVAGFIAKARARMQAEPARREHPENLLEAMIAAADRDGSGIDDAQVAGNVLTMLLAGEDTTANTLAWMIDLLWRHPAALQLACDEVRRVVGSGGVAAITPQQLAELDYVEACAHETMRLKPVAPMLPLQALRDTTVGDVAVKAGTIVMCLLRRDSVSETHVEQAASLRPERWLEAAAAPAHAAKRVSMPFGAGPRICPGRYLALLEIKLAMAALLSHFDIEAVATPDGGETPERMAFTMTPLGLTMRLRAR
jgi:cytochrome P450